MNKKTDSWLQNLWRDLGRSSRWLMPGLGVKRWVFVILLGTTLLGIGFGIFILDVYRSTPSDAQPWWIALLSTIALRALARPIRVLIFGSLGVGLVLGGIWGLNRALLSPYIQPGKTVVDTLAGHRRRERGPRVVVIGGGHGISMLLRGLKAYTHNLTAVVTVADDGGSSGRLRRSMGILPPGDLRNCLAALSNDEALLTQLFQYRFANGGADLVGHSFGNLFISALAELTGSFEEAIAESGRVLAVHGRVLPSSLHDVKLVADIVPPHTNQEIRVAGESRIPETKGRIHRVWLEPDNPPAFPGVIKALLSADLILIGPGSLYTSILPNLLVPDIAAAIQASPALKIYVANVATQPGETDGFNCADHVQALEDHVGGGLFDLLVCNLNYEGKLLDGMNWVTIDEDFVPNYAVYKADLVDEDEPWHHDETKLAQVLIDIYQDRTGALAESQ
ncbi:MAG: uridine diphosphate-N-acetylglucosamine-binding protein YvcK [Anaerolineales bacterium]